MDNPKLDYAEIAGNYDRLRTPSKDTLNYWLNVIIEYAKVGRNSKLLDIGCGTGRYTIPIARKTKSTVYGLDQSTEMLSEAKKKDINKTVKWKGGRAEALQYADDYFDCVFMSFTIHQLKDKKKAIEEVHRVLHPKGRILIMTTSHNHFRRSPLHDFPNLRKIDLGRFPSLPDLKELLISYGFINVISHSLTRKKRYVSVEEYIKQAKEKPISTFNLLSESEYKEGLIEFEKRLRKKYGTQAPYYNEYSFVMGDKD